MKSSKPSKPGSQQQLHFRNSKNNISADIVGGREARKEVERILGWIDRAVREVFKKKNGKKAVRLTAWVDPPSPSPEAVRKM